MRFGVRALGVVSLLSIMAYAQGCGSDSSTPAGNGDTDAGGGGGGNLDAGGGGNPGSDAGTTAAGLLGVWQISGKDSRGAYTGQLELRDDGGANATVIRIVQYTSVTVEDSRELWTAWTGTAKKTQAGYLLDVSLLKADFVRSRGGITRAEADKTPLAVSGTVTLGSNGTATTVWKGSDADATDTMTARANSGAKPIFATDRVKSPVNSAPAGAAKTTADSLFQSYRDLPAVKPYANEPDFKAGVGYAIVDKTDFDFYQAHPKALRVVNKVVDAPSLGETLARATAFGQKLADKAAYFDTETPAKLIDSTGSINDNLSNGVLSPTGDGSLWTASYVASQAYRYMATKDAAALANIEKSTAAIEILLEITPDQSTFARTVRPATGSATGSWHAGVGAFAAYDWLEGGNNDMFKGLFYGQLMAYIAICDPVLPGKTAFCDRIRTNTKHMVKDLALAQSTTDANHLMSVWLSAYVNNDSGDLTAAVTSWAALQSSIEQANFQQREYMTGDWSGTHLTFAQFISMHWLAAKKPLPAINADTSVRKGFDKMKSDFSPFRMGLWSVVFSKLASASDPADVDNARWRLREIPSPRSMLDVDHRVGAAFVMAPYPSLPWKNDWTTTDRTEGLYGYPLFETPLDVYAWRSGPFDYRENTVDHEYPGADYLHAYWLGRQLGLFTATE
jgi:hypothetical protein